MMRCIYESASSFKHIRICVIVVREKERRRENLKNMLQKKKSFLSRKMENGFCW